MTCFKILILTVLALSIPSLSWSPKGGASAKRMDIIVVGKGTRPKWSPDGARIVYLSGGKLVVYSTKDSTKVELCDFSRPQYYWADSATVVVLRGVKSHSTHTVKGVAIESYSPHGKLLTTQSFPVSLSTRGNVRARRSSKGFLRIHDSRTIGENSFLPLMTSSTSRTTLSGDEIFVVSTRYYHFAESWNIPFGSDIWSVGSLGEPKRLIAKSPPTNDFMSPHISPNGNLVLFSDGVGTRLFTISGDSVGAVVEATYSTWIPHSSSFVYTAISDDGYDLTASDIYVSDSSCMHPTQITNTPEKIELYASQSRKGLIVYSDYNSGLVEIITSYKSEGR